VSSIAKLAKPRANRILGIDSSTTSLAFCIFDEKPIKWGKINFYGATIHDKIIDAHQKVAANKDLLSVDYICIESAIMVKSQDVAIKMAMIVGSVVSALAWRKDMIVTVPPSAWQPFIGNKNFTKVEKDNLRKDFPGKSDSWYRNKAREMRKQKTMDYFNNKYNINVEDHDAGDAMGIAYYAYHKLVNNG
jgi:Holliday junction resolvasome RuvABC endonuclease subunit